MSLSRKIKPLDYFTSYSHRGCSTLREIARFEEKGLWSHATVWFSQLGTLLSTAESFLNRSPRGYFAHELAGTLHVDVQDAFHQLAQQRQITRRRCLPYSHHFRFWTPLIRLRYGADV
jgi:hypothetical protein